MSNKRGLKKFKYTEKDVGVLLKVFSQLPTLQLAYCVRGASVAWRELVDSDQTMRRLLRRRAQVLEREAQHKGSTDPFFDVEAIDTTPFAEQQDERNKRVHVLVDLQRCLASLSAVQLQWDCERVFRRYRQATLQPLANLCEYWEACAPTSDTPWAAAVADESRKSHQTLQMRVLHDCNDRSAERHVFRVRNDRGDSEDQ